ncbi:MAG: 50S ribosome-binding GTPase, partial [Pirellulales bacterium]|nr:50S ribosome-binding GTPase [Pirellulales bacterium]
ADALAETLATVEAAIDLAEERIELADPAELAGQLRTTATELDQLAASAIDMPDTAEMPSVVLVGRPNVGKSSLVNTVTGTDRAIISAQAGTTRDVLTALWHLPCGTTVELLDAAGFVDPQDAVAMAADSAARNAVTRADMILFVIDSCVSDEIADTSLLYETRQTNRHAPMLIVCNKSDLIENATPPSFVPEQTIPRTKTSCATGDGLAELAAQVTEMLHLSADRSGQAIGLHARQRRCLLEAAEAAGRTACLLASAKEIADVSELAAVELREALAQLGAISGQIVTEDILGRIFARFCVGK